MEEYLATYWVPSLGTLMINFLGAGIVAHHFGFWIAHIAHTTAGLMQNTSYSTILGLPLLLIWYGWHVPLDR